MGLHAKAESEIVERESERREETETEAVGATITNEEKHDEVARTEEEEAARVRAPLFVCVSLRPSACSPFSSTVSMEKMAEEEEERVCF